MSSEFWLNEVIQNAFKQIEELPDWLKPNLMENKPAEALELSANQYAPERV